MGDKTTEIIGPVAWLPAGLISWYAPDGCVVALVTSWLALIGGENPRVRTAWHGRHDPLSHFWPGGDFVLNVPTEEGLKEVQGAMARGCLCLTAKHGFSMASAAGIVAVAPRLLECAVQLECVGGVLVGSGSDMELCGDVVRVHRKQVIIDPSDIPDLCAIQPLRPV